MRIIKDLSSIMSIRKNIYNFMSNKQKNKKQKTKQKTKNKKPVLWCICVIG